MLFNHTKVILKEAEKHFSNATLSIKVSGIHWMYAHPSHAAELTAGYINLPDQKLFEKGYENIITQVLGNKTHFDFTCLEMLDS